jgi:hypothetical protein
MATNGSFAFTVASGTPGSVTAAGGTLKDGTYTIVVAQDNTGTSLTVETPYGTTGQSGFAVGDDIE